MEILYDEPIETYHRKGEHINKSRLFQWLNDPSLFDVDMPVKKSDSIKTGDLVHKSFEVGYDKTMEWEIIPEEHSTLTGWKSTKKTKEFRESLSPDITWISAADHYLLSDMWQQIRANSAAQSVVDAIAHHEVSIRWSRPDGTQLKCRPDAITKDGRVVDWKTCRYANPLKDWWKAVVDYGYHLQDALYREGAKEAGWSDEPLIFVLISTAGSHQVQVVELPNEACVIGKRMLEEAIEGIAAHKAFGTRLVPQGYGAVNTLPVPRSVFSLENSNGSNDNSVW